MAVLTDSGFIYLLLHQEWDLGEPGTAGFPATGGGGYGYGLTELLTHQQVYDIAFSRAGGGRDMFASVGADGSVRMFDLRHLEHSTIIYEDPQHHPLLRLCWNKQDPNYLATMAMDGMEVSTPLQALIGLAPTSGTAYCIQKTGSQLLAIFSSEDLFKCLETFSVALTWG